MVMVRVVLLLLVVTAFSGCNTSVIENGPFASGRVLGVNKSHALEETSGLASSTRYPGMLWAHNDSGNPAELFLLDSSAQTVASFRLSNSRNRDWEDIAIAPGPDSTDWLFVGDIGDNSNKHKYLYIYCLKEPDLNGSGEAIVSDTVIISLADKPRDAEALLADPVSRNLYIVTKREKEVHVYEVPYPFADTVVAASALRLPIRYITAGDISRDGSEILLKSYTAIYYWKRAPGESVLDALRAAPQELTYAHEPQGEALSWAVDGSGFYTLSENAKGERGRLLFHARIDTTKNR